jgi:hypothetical protein
LSSGRLGGTIYSPKDHPRIAASELAHIERGGGLVDMDRDAKARLSAAGPKRSYLAQLLGNRMLLGVYIGSTAITTITYFFLTWFPVYLVEQRGMSILKAGVAASLPAICGLLGGVLGRCVLGSPAQVRLLAHRRAQDPHRARHAPLHDDDRVQLRGLGVGGGRHHGAGVLRQGHRVAGLGGGL